jgi:hypothetical protein
MEPPHRLRSLRATLSGLHPFPSPQRPDYWIFGRMAGPRSPRSSVLPTFGPSTKRAPPNTPSADSCAAIFDPYGSLSLQPETRRRSPEVRSTAFTARPPDLPPRSLMAVDFAILCSLVRPGRPRYPVFVHRAAALLHASFRPHLAMTPLRFANPSPPSGWIEDFHLQAVDHARHTKKDRQCGGPSEIRSGVLIRPREPSVFCASQVDPTHRGRWRRAGERRLRCSGSMQMTIS